MNHAPQRWETVIYEDCREVLEYSRLADFSNRSIETLEIRLGELRSFARTRKLKSISAAAR
jgi:hypothetical protein